MRDKSRPYQVYTQYIVIPLIMLAAFGGNFTHWQYLVLGTMVFLAALMTHVGVRKLTGIGGIKHVGPILIDLIWILNGIMAVLIQVGQVDQVRPWLVGLLIALKIGALVSFFWAAWKIKQAYPNRQADAMAARAAYLAVKRRKWSMVIFKAAKMCYNLSMRLDKFLKVSRLIKRRTVAKEVADKGRIKLNGRLAKSSSDVVYNDELEIRFGNKIVKVKVLETKEFTRKDDAEKMYQLISETRIQSTEDDED